MSLFENDPNASDALYKNLQKDIWWFDPPDFPRKHVEELYSISNDILDKKFLNQCKHNFHSCYAEMYFAATFRTRCGFTVTHPSDKGPDFYIEDLNCWSEVVSPKDGDENNLNTIPKPIPGKVQSHPEEQIILRLTNAFHDKSQKLKSDIAKGIVDPTQPLILCISGGGLQEAIPMYPQGGYPPIVKTLLPVGNLVFWINKENKKIISKEFKYRQGVTKKSEKGDKIIETDYFLNSEHSHISAVIYSYANANHPSEKKVWGNDFFTIHNPKAINPLKVGSIKCGKEYVITTSHDSFAIEKEITY